MVSTTLMSWLSPGLVWPNLTIAGISGLISVFALIPGMSLGEQPSRQVSSSNGSPRGPASTRTMLFIVASVAAMAIRFLGTVALLVACRYHLGLPLQTLAFLVCGWYVVLTSVEITWLAKGASMLDSKRHDLGLPLAASKTWSDGTEC